MAIAKEKDDLDLEKKGDADHAASATKATQRPVASLTMAVVKRGSTRVELERPPEIEAVRPGPSFAPPSPTEPSTEELAELESLAYQQPEQNGLSVASEVTQPLASEKPKFEDGNVEAEVDIDSAPDPEDQGRDVIKSIRRDNAETELDFSEESEDSTREQSGRSRLASLTWREFGFFSVLYVFALLLFGSLFDFWSVLGLN